MYQGPSRAPEIAAFMADDPALWAADIDEAVTAILARFGTVTEREADEAFDLLRQLKAARLADPKNDLERLIEWTRLAHGARMAAEMLLKYGATAHGGTQASLDTPSETGVGLGREAA